MPRLCARDEVWRRKVAKEEEGVALNAWMGFEAKRGLWWAVCVDRQPVLCARDEVWHRWVHSATDTAVKAPRFSPAKFVWRWGYRGLKDQGSSTSLYI